ncbi:uncharacterized protein LOC129618343 [Condylostylus longicornis]|uniref:uncharacterized protein LOC129618343 n=1 Tax=Condylostylus longicornis TaxID=2530218 RepID=UPI00244E4416|nr:uncharacterized protein LOC129618343 [Condylostylus longicornis]
MLKQPINQVRLTNIAVMRLKKDGKRFEVACFKNKILNWRIGTETDLSEVLQTEEIFSNVSKGQFAKIQDLQKAFGTKDRTAIARIIMRDGQLQVSEKERQVKKDDVFKDVCSLVSERVFNRETGLPLPLSMIENTLTRLGFSVSIEIAPKRQSLKAIELLCNGLPKQIGVRQMLLKLVGKTSQMEEIHYLLDERVFAMITSEHPVFEKRKIQETEASKEKEGLDQSEQPDKSQQPDQPQQPDQAEHLDLSHQLDKSQELDQQPDQPEQLQQEINNAQSQIINKEDYTVTFYCNPAHYRDIDHFVTEVLKPPGSLQIVASRECITNAVEISNRESIEAPKEESKHPIGEQTKPSKEIDKTGSSSKMTNVGAIECRTCSKECESQLIYRNHCKTQWHQLNVKRKFKGLAPITEEEFVELSLDVACGFLAVD